MDKLILISLIEKHTAIGYKSILIVSH